MAIKEKNVGLSKFYLQIAKAIGSNFNRYVYLHFFGLIDFVFGY